MTGFVAHGAVFLQFAIETPISNQARSGWVDIADAVVKFGSGASHIPYTTFAHAAVEHTCEANRAADCKCIFPRVAIVSHAEVDSTAVFGFNKLNLFAVEVNAEELTVVNGSKVVPFAGIEFLVSPSFVVVLLVGVRSRAD